MHFPQSLCSRESWPRSVNRGPGFTDSVPLADQRMVLRSNTPPRRLAVGDSGQERSGPSCLAPEEDQLRDAGLPDHTVETIQS